MKRLVVLAVLVVALLAVNVTAPDEASAWGCPYGVPFCTLGNDAQCDAWCGMTGWGVCERPGCCSCLG